MLNITGAGTKHNTKHFCNAIAIKNDRHILDCHANPTTARLLIRDFGSHGWSWPLGFPWAFGLGRRLLLERHGRGCV